MQILSKWLFLAIDEFVVLNFETEDQKQIQLNKFCETVAAVLSAVTAVKGVPHEHFFVFDKVAYLLLSHKEEVTVAYWTEICH